MANSETGGISDTILNPEAFPPIPSKNSQWDDSEKAREARSRWNALLELTDKEMRMKSNAPPTKNLFNLNLLANTADNITSKNIAILNFGRFQPPHKGHIEMVEYIIETSKELNNGDGHAYIFPSKKDNKLEKIKKKNTYTRSKEYDIMQRNSKRGLFCSNKYNENPLKIWWKTYFLKKQLYAAGLIERVNLIVDETVYDPTTAIKFLKKLGYEKIILIVGSDRYAKFKTLWEEKAKIVLVQLKPGSRKDTVSGTYTRELALKYKMYLEKEKKVKLTESESIAKNRFMGELLEKLGVKNTKPPWVNLLIDHIFEGSFSKDDIKKIKNGEKHFWNFNTIGLCKPRRSQRLKTKLEQQKIYEVEKRIAANESVERIIDIWGETGKETLEKMAGWEREPEETLAAALLLGLKEKRKGKELWPNMSKNKYIGDKTHKKLVGGKRNMSRSKKTRRKRKKHTQKKRGGDIKRRTRRKKHKKYRKTRRRKQRT